MKILQVSALVVILDQITKALIRAHLTIYESVPVIPSFFHLTFVTNDGMAFGLEFPGNSLVFNLVVIIVTAVLFWFLWKERSSPVMIRLALALIIGGALGNLIDRILFGEVVDFLDFMIGDFHWFIFNISDSSITIGMFFFLYFSFFIQPKLQTKQTA